MASIEQADGGSPGTDVPLGVPVFSGSQAACAESALVLDAKGLAYDRVKSADSWLLLVAPADAQIARDELARYAAERVPRPGIATPFVAFPGSVAGAGMYALVLIASAYCAGINLFGVDWYAVGALESRSGMAGEWWRALTALTLHVDQEHLLGNLLFGAGIGILAGRMFGPGFAWLSILLAGAAGNYVDLLVSPAWHRAVGASTAVFAGLGLLSGFGWGRRRHGSDRRLYRWAPLFGGICLLALLGAANEHVDVVGHVLGFLAGTGLGWTFARAGVPRTRNTVFQLVCGALAGLALVAAWYLAIRRA